MTKTSFTLVAAALAAACTDLSSPEPAGPPKPRAVSTGVQQTPYATLDLEYVAIASAESSFGGMFLDSTQTPVVFLTDTTRFAAARQAGVDASLASRGKSTSHIRVRQAAYNFLQLKRWRDSASNAVARAGPTTYGIDKAHNRLHVGVIDSTARQTVEAQLRGLGIPLAAVEIKFERPVVPLITHGNENVTDSVRPVRGGIFIEFAANGGFPRCTLSLLMKQNGNLYFVTASHCSSSQGTVDGTEYYQNYIYNGNDKLGKEVRDPAYSDGWISYVNEWCPTGGLFQHHYCRVSDANVDSIYPEFAGTMMKGLIARTQSPGRGLTAGSLLLDLNSPGLFIKGAGGSPMVGDSVWKTGWKTGTTGGVIRAVCYDVSYESPDMSDRDLTILCADAVGAWDRPGDSGSPVYTWDRASGDSTVILQGILFANDDPDDDGDMSAYYFSPWNFIVDELGSMDPVADSLHFMNDVGAWISGDSVVAPGTHPYYANRTGGTGSYTYQWNYQNAGSSNWIALGTGQLQDRSVDASTPSFTIRVTVTSGSLTKAATFDVRVTTVTGVSIDGPTLVWIGQACTWVGAVATGTPPLIFQWDVDGQGNQNPVQVDTTSASSDNFSYQANSVANPFTISLTVTDAAGASGFTWLGVNPAGYGCGY
jgi:hypothetical protein